MEKIRNEFLAQCAKLREVDSGHAMVRAILLSQTSAIVNFIEKLPPRMELGGVHIEQKAMAEGFLAYLDTSDIYLELIHSSAVQSWHSFLDDLFSWALRAHMAGEIEFSKPKQQLSIRVKFPEDRTVADFEKRICETFSFLGHREKFKFLRDMLEVNFQSSDKQNLLKIIQKQIDIRNILQHSEGIVREEDTKHYPQGIEVVDESKGQIVYYHAGDRIKLTKLELSIALASFERVAKLLTSKNS